VCYFLLRRSWQHDVDATHGGKNIYLFTWKDKRVAMKLIPPTPKPTKEEKPKFISICNEGLFVELNEIKQSFALMVKKEVVFSTEISEEMTL